ncbi:SIR2 family protein [bacterium]|nr:SIR2 family protein [bacterium]NUN45918.1 tetratricopeptide repeat protein [bacterium]
MDQPEEIELQTFIKQFHRDRVSVRKYCFILGAGASKQSGIPTGGELAKIWLDGIKNLYRSQYDQWKNEKNIDEQNPAIHYSAIYDKRFKLNPEEGFAQLVQIMDGKEPSIGYSVLAQLLTDPFHNVVITTNFDSMTEDALFIYTRRKPLVCGHESLASFINITSNRPVIAKIHRDLLFAPKSNSDETSQLAKGWIDALTQIFRYYTPVFIGYGGNDGSLMEYLEKLETLSNGMFWCYRNADGKPNERIQKLLTNQKGFLIPIDGFDEMMIALNEEMEYPLKDQEILNVAEQRVKKYREQIEKLNKENPASETARAIELANEKSPRTWWSVELEVQTEEDLNKKDNIYKKGLNEFPDSIDLYACYAVFLTDFLKDYNKAENFYKKALSKNQNHFYINGNYANFLNRIKKDYKAAEKYYKKAIELDPENPDNYGNYGIFLHTIRQNDNEAAICYSKAINLGTINPIIFGNFAQLLIWKREFPNAETKIYEAFLFPTHDEKQIYLELWFYRFANFYNQYGDACYDEILKLIRSGVRSPGWNLKPNIELAHEYGHPHVALLEKLDKVITEDAPVDILPDKP